MLRALVCACVCVCVRVCASVCECVRVSASVCEREKERERGGGRKIHIKRDKEGESEIYTDRGIEKA